MLARSCDQLCPITADHIGELPQQCQLSMSISASCQCSSMPPASAHQCHINATYQCPSDLPFSVTYQCQSVPPINAMPVSAT
ncbi:unnamed protein product [Staurois parvus]|uniref:Uncharacterized protein n=1 Tax=Staurois parvus TaxID=386267 RepID=A0ABN9G1B3_9NEOB|nr:unnamed protein product [Staurois parvus]